MSSNATYQKLIEILQETREALARPGNNFVWSSWHNADEALREVDGFISRIEGGDMPGQMDLKLLFAPTGSIQEVAVSSGWGGEFLELAERFDATMESL